MKVAAREIREMLKERLDELLGQLFSGERIHYPTMSPRNPSRDDKTPGSFVIWTRGAAKGGYRDYATSQSGDIIDLIALAHNKEGDHKFAFDYARDFLGLAKMSHQAVRAAKDRAKRQASVAAAAEDALAASRRRRAIELFLSARPILGTIAEDYLGTRGIALSAIPNREDDLRFAPKLEWWKGATWEKGQRVARGPDLPAMVAAFRNAAGDITAVHCTFLRNDGSGKADVDQPKLMLGDVRGSVIRLSRGPSNLSWEEAALNGVRDIHVPAEGIETGLSCAVSLPEARCCAVGSLGNLGNFPASHASIAQIVAAAENDWQSPQAREALDKALDTLRAAGVPVSAMTPHEGKDMNDLLRGAA
jgi:hypothetical protein